MRKLMIGVAAVAMGTGVLSDFAKVNAAPIQWKVADGGNGHFYEAFVVPGGITWTDARAAAIAAGGDLATITSPEENQFVFGLIDSNAYWTHPGGWWGPWIGGIQTPQFAVPIQDPAADWHWVTGEPWDYTAWATFEPNDSTRVREEDRLMYGSPYTSPVRTPTWADNMGGDPTISYVVETVPEPSTVVLIGMGAFGLLAYAWRRRKRTV